jgi:molecular chaperone GrpE
METMQQNEGPKLDSVPVTPDEGVVDGSTEVQSQDLGEALAAAEAEAAEYKDKFLRVAAEMDNMRRRFEKERTDILQYGLEKVMSDLLPVLDALEKAHADVKASQHGEPSALYEGLELLQKQLVSTLEKHGLAAVDPQGQPFDPNFHQAIQKVDSADVQTESVQMVYQKGYTLHSRLVRPAMVCVAVPSVDNEKNN